MISYLTEKRDRHSRVKHIVKDILTPLSDSDKEDVFMIAERLIKANIPYELGVLTSEDVIELYKESEHPKAVFVIQPEQDSFMGGYVIVRIIQLLLLRILLQQQKRTTVGGISMRKIITVTLIVL